VQGLPEVSIGALLVAFLPSLALVAVMRAWSLQAGQALIANIRMLVQLLAIGYVLVFVFETENPWIVAAVLVMMMGVAASAAWPCWPW
jgi:putative ABC transport system permease protein